MSTDQESSACPLSAVDRRLDDVHQQWHQAEDAYFDPERFRIAIQTTIQTLRTVTFILQNRKDDIPDFDVWYSGWQERLRADPLMRWMVDARNKIQKRGDLEVHSFVRAEIIASYLNEGPSIELPARLFDDPQRLIDSIPAGTLREHIRNHGTLRIQRRWIENTLPDCELLDAVAIAYGRISTLVYDAHRQMGLHEPVTTDMETGRHYGGGARNGRLPCMIGHAEARSLNISLADGQVLQFEHVAKEIDRNDAEKAAERYGGAHKAMLGPDDAKEEEIAASLFRTARNVFLKDGYHESIFFLFKERKVVHLFAMRAEEHGQKYLLMRTLAHEVTKYGADCVMGLSEAWLAPADLLKPYLRAADSSQREEALTATLVTKNGNPIQLTAKIRRDGEGLALDETIVNRDAALFSFAPVYEAWERPIPDEWLKAVEELASARGRPP
jgi:hypothetical protein